MKIRFSKIDLDNYSTFLGFAIGVLGILISFKYVDPRVGGVVFAILKLAEGYLTNKPADKHPTTKDLER